MGFKNISVEETKQLIDTGNINIIDIRDSGSYSSGHINNAMHAEDMDIDAFLVEEDKEKPLLIYCYHGVSSQPAAEYFTEHGFANVYSLEGGYTAWPKE